LPITASEVNHGFSSGPSKFVIRQARNLHPVTVDNTSLILVTYLYLANHGTSQPSTTLLSQPIRTLHQKHSLISHGASSSQSELCISSNIATVSCKPVALPQSDQKRLSSDLSSLSFSKEALNLTYHSSFCGQSQLIDWSANLYTCQAIHHAKCPFSSAHSQLFSFGQPYLFIPPIRAIKPSKTAIQSAYHWDSFGQSHLCILPITAFPPANHSAI
jgi:hypothetical protein